MRQAQDIRAAVEDELRCDPLGDATDITVMTIGGEVALNGSVPSYPQYLEAAGAARRIAGVTSVHNHLKVVLPLDDECDDAMLTTATNNMLAANSTVPDGIEAIARHGDLYLTGTVDYGSQRAAVEAVAAKLRGVRGINDRIEVNYHTDPADVARLVHDALARHALVPDDSDVAAATAGNTVTLTGHVRTPAERDAVVGAAWVASGVGAVVDELHITG